MSHTVKWMSRHMLRKKVFHQITAVKNVNAIPKDNWIILVQNEDTVDIWTASHRVRGCNDLVRYYELWYGREINEQDIVVLSPLGQNIRTIY